MRKNGSNEEFYKVLDVFGFRSVMFVEWGFRPADVRRTTERIKHPMAVVKQWVRTAEQEQKLAEEAEASGHRESAAEFYYRAALYYGPPCGVIHANTPKKLELYKRMIHCYTRFTELFDEASVRRVEIPFENGKTIPGVLQTVPGAKGKTPVVLVIPGMDTIKEYMPSPYHNHFRRRGMATLDHRRSRPGREQHARDLGHARQLRARRQGGDRLHRKDPGTRCQPKSASTAGAWAATGARALPLSIRASRRWSAPWVTILQKDTIFQHSKPAYRANYMYMSNIYDEDAFDAMAKQMTLEPIAAKIKCPTLLAMGEYDELCPLADGERMFDMLTCPKELWVYEDESHTFGSRLPDFYLHVADWMRDALNGKFPAGHKKRIDHAAR